MDKYLPTEGPIDNYEIIDIIFHGAFKDYFMYVITTIPDKEGIRETGVALYYLEDYWNCSSTIFSKNKKKKDAITAHEYVTTLIKNKQYEIRPNHTIKLIIPEE